MGHFTHVCKIKFGASRNLLKYRTPRLTTSSDGPRYKPQNSVTQWMLQIPVLMKQMSRLVTAMIRNSTANNITQKTARGQDRNRECSGTHFCWFWTSVKHAVYWDPSAKEAILQQKEIPLAPTKTRIHAFSAQIPLRLRGKFSSGSYKTSIELSILQLQFNFISDNPNNSPNSAAMIERDLESLTILVPRGHASSVFVSTKSCHLLESSTLEVRDSWTFPSLCLCPESIRIRKRLFCACSEKLDLPWGRDTWCWPKGARPLGDKKLPWLATTKPCNRKQC